MGVIGVVPTAAWGGERDREHEVVVAQQHRQALADQQAQQHTPRETDSAGIPVTVQSYVAKLPHTVTLPQGKRARVRVLASHDPANVGTYTVLADPTQGWVTCRRLVCARSS